MHSHWYPGTPEALTLNTPQTNSGQPLLSLHLEGFLPLQTMQSPIQDRTGARQPLHSCWEERHPLISALQLQALQRAASEQGGAALPWDPSGTTHANRPNIPVCTVPIRGNPCVPVPWRPSPAAAHTGAGEVTQREHQSPAGSVGDTRTQPLPPEQHMQKPKDIMQEIRIRLKPWEAFPVLLCTV